MGNSQETDLVCKEMEKEVNSRFLFFSLKDDESNVTKKHCQKKKFKKKKKDLKDVIRRGTHEKKKRERDAMRQPANAFAGMRARNDTSSKIKKHTLPLEQRDPQRSPISHLFPPDSDLVQKHSLVRDQVRDRVVECADTVGRITLLHGAELGHEGALKAFCLLDQFDGGHSCETW